jgi:hypothetical protein
MRRAGGATEAVADVSGLLGGPHDLANEGVRVAPGAAAIANTAELDADVVVTRAQNCSPLRQFGDGGQRIETVGVSIGSAGRGVQRDGKIALSGQPLAPCRKAALLSCHPLVGSPPPPSLPPNPHQLAKAREPVIAVSPQGDLRTKRPSSSEGVVNGRLLIALNSCSRPALGLLTLVPLTCSAFVGNRALDQA